MHARVAATPSVSMRLAAASAAKTTHRISSPWLPTRAPLHPPICSRRTAASIAPAAPASPWGEAPAAARRTRHRVRARRCRPAARLPRPRAAPPPAPAPRPTSRLQQRCAVPPARQGPTARRSAGCWSCASGDEQRQRRLGGQRQRQCVWRSSPLWGRRGGCERDVPIPRRCSSRRRARGRGARARGGARRRQCQRGCAWRAGGRGLLRARARGRRPGPGPRAGAGPQTSERGSVGGALGVETSGVRGSGMERRTVLVLDGAHAVAAAVDTFGRAPGVSRGLGVAALRLLHAGAGGVAARSRRVRSLLTTCPRASRRPYSPACRP